MYTGEWLLVRTNDMPTRPTVVPPHRPSILRAPQDPANSRKTEDFPTKAIVTGVPKSPSPAMSAVHILPRCVSASSVRRRRSHRQARGRLARAMTRHGCTPEAGLWRIRILRGGSERCSCPVHTEVWSSSAVGARRGCRSDDPPYLPQGRPICADLQGSLTLPPPPRRSGGLRQR